MKIRRVNKEDFLRVSRPQKDSHKGNNGRLLVIGGSKLFHASIFWTADVASKLMDLVHFSSPANENNEVVRKRLKEGFWNGIVVDWSEVETYIKEDDCVVVGPGMVRAELNSKSENLIDKDLVLAGLEDNTREIVNKLLAKYGEKKWVVDGGALQECDPELLTGSMIITPHLGEWERLVGKLDEKDLQKKLLELNLEEVCQWVESVSKSLNGVGILLKGVEGKDICYKS